MKGASERLRRRSWALDGVCRILPAMNAFTGSLQRKRHRYYLVVTLHHRQKWVSLKTDRLALARQRAAARLGRDHRTRRGRHARALHPAVGRRAPRSGRASDPVAVAYVAARRIAARCAAMCATAQAHRPAMSWKWSPLNLNSSVEPFFEGCFCRVTTMPCPASCVKSVYGCEVRRQVAT